MKGGTSTLFRYLSDHPDIEPSSRKETNFFATTDCFSKGLNWYESLYEKNNAQYSFEASPNYTKRHVSPGVAERMYSVLPNIKLIYLLRDPIERTLSHYIHNYACGSESRSFSEVIKDTGDGNNYIQTSKYYFQIQAFLEYYSEKQIFMIESETLRKDPVMVLREVVAFLGITNEYYSDSTRILKKCFHQSSNKKRRTLFEEELRKKTNNRFLLHQIKKICKPFRKPIEKPVVSSAERARLAEAFAPDVEKLRHFSGMKFLRWSL